MKSLMIATILMLVLLVACETEDSVEGTSIIMDEGSTIVVSASNEESPDEQLDFIDGIVQNLIVKHNCYVGETILLEATVLGRSLLLTDGKPDFFESLALETNTDKLWIGVDMTPVNKFLPCLNYYNEGETYVFPLLVISLQAHKSWDWREGDPLSFDVHTKIVITEELEKELRKVDCGNDED